MNKDCELLLDITEDHIQVFWKDKWHSVGRKELEKIVEVGLITLQRHYMDNCAPLQNFPIGLKKILKDRKENER